MPKKAAGTKGSPLIYKRILVSLISEGLHAEMKWFLERAPVEVKESSELMVAELDYLMRKSENDSAFKLAERMVQTNIKEPSAFHAAIKLSIDMNRKYTLIEDLIERAMEIFPDQRATFSIYRNLISQEPPQNSNE